MPRTSTKHLQVFTRPAPNAAVFRMPTSTSAAGESGRFDPNVNVVTITVPVGSKWTSGLHWHEEHVEFLEIAQGKALVTLGRSTKVYGAKDGVIRVDKFVRHEWRRPSTSATHATEDDSQDLVVREYTLPSDGKKEAFFRNLYSTLLDPYTTSPITFYTIKTPIPIGWYIELQLFLIAADWDSYAVLYSPSLPRIGVTDVMHQVTGKVEEGLQYAITHMALFLAHMLAWLFGMRSAFEEYTPEELLRRPKNHIKAN